MYINNHLECLTFDKPSLPELIILLLLNTHLFLKNHLRIQQ